MDAPAETAKDMMLSTAAALTTVLIAQTGTVRGRAEDLDAKPAAGVHVFVCDFHTGIPLTADGTPFSSRVVDGKPGLLRAETDEPGRFELAVPPGSYRLIGQAWSESPSRPEHRGNPFQVHGENVTLFGVMEEIKVRAGARFGAVLRPLGRGELELDLDLPNDGTLCLVSTSPLQHDAILGFAAWKGRFLRNLIGVNRMPDGVTALRGLPAGTIYLATFSNDNNASWGFAEVDIEAGERQTGKAVNWVGGWAGVPARVPDHIERLREKIRADEVVELLRAHDLGPRPEEDGLQGMFTWTWRVVDETLTVRGETFEVGDLLASHYYARMRRD